MIAWIKEHPYLAGGLILGIVVLIVIFRNATNSNSQAATTSSNGVSDTQAVAALNANAAIEQMAYQAQTQVAGYNAAVNQTALQAAAATAVTSIQAGGIAPYSVAGTPGYNAAITPGSSLVHPSALVTNPAPPASTVVGHTEVQGANAAAGASQNNQIAAVSNQQAQMNTIKTPIPTASPVTLPNGNTVTFVPSTPTQVGSGITPGLPSPVGYNSESDYLAAVQASQGVNPQTAGLYSSINQAGLIQTLGNEAAAEWQAFFGPGSTSETTTEPVGAPAAAPTRPNTFTSSPNRRNAILRSV